MGGLLLERAFPGATTCVLVGELDSGSDIDLRSYRSILRFVADSGNAPALRTAATVETIALADAVPSRVSTALESFVRRDPRHLPTLCVTDAALAWPAEPYQRLLDQVHTTLEAHHRARVTRQQDGFLWQKHLLENLPAYATRRVPESWSGALRGCPAFVCGAGPSLDATAPKLAAIANGGIVFAADSALRALARHGVRVDFAVSIDVAKQPEKCLAHGPAPSRVVLSAVSPPAWRQAVPAEAQYFLSSGQVTLDWIAQHGIARTAIATTENCGSTALELARFLGCAPIHLFGLDLALDSTNPAQRHHAGVDATLYAKSNFNAAQEFPRVPGNHAREVLTHVFGDWRALDERLAGWPADLVVNVNDRGARLRNTTIVHPDRFTFESPVTDKVCALAGLAVPSAPDASVMHEAFSRLGDAGRHGASQIPALRAALERGGPPAVVAALRPLFAAQDFGRAMGAFSLKIMPHLVPPVEGDTAFWHALLDELAELAHLAGIISATAGH
jgi:hypothetical protein